MILTHYLPVESEELLMAFEAAEQQKFQQHQYWHQ